VDQTGISPGFQLERQKLKIRVFPKVKFLGIFSLIRAKLNSVEEGYLVEIKLGFPTYFNGIP
jgi:hypothetical protein